MDSEDDSGKKTETNIGEGLSIGPLLTPCSTASKALHEAGLKHQISILKEKNHVIYISALDKLHIKQKQQLGRQLSNILLDKTA